MSNLGIQQVVLDLYRILPPGWSVEVVHVDDDRDDLLVEIIMRASENGIVHSNRRLIAIKNLQMLAFPAIDEWVNAMRHQMMTSMVAKTRKEEPA